MHGSGVAWEGNLNMYIQGFTLAVPAEKKAEFVDHAKEVADYFKGLGVTRIVEGWGEDIRDGERTDFKRAVNAEPGEAVVFSWHEYPDRAARDRVFETMMKDPVMQEIGARMPADGKRMIFGGFEAVLVDGEPGAARFLDGGMGPAVRDKAVYARQAAAFAARARELGALRIVDGWGDDVPDGKLTDMRRAVAAEPGETVLFFWIEWPSRETRDAAWATLMSDGSMGPETMPFDPARAIFGGFEVVLDA